jgi:hypothetical protein
MMTGSRKARSPYSKKWLWVRVSVMVLAACAGPRTVSKQAGNPTTWAECILVGFSLTVTTFLLMCIAALGREKWLRPSWYTNPFDPREPFQAAHAFSFWFLAGAAGASCLLIVQGPTVAPDVALYFSFGGGFWLALRLCTIVFHKKFVRADTTPSS